MKREFELENVWMKLLAVNLVIFLVQFATSHRYDALFTLSGSTIATAPWTAITSMFMHSGLWHLFFNSWALFVFGPMLERQIGGKKFLLLYLLAGLAASAAFLLFYPASIHGLGASGAIYGVIGCLAVLMPNVMLLVMFVPMPLWMAAGLWALLDVVGTLDPSNPIAAAAHLGGLALGIMAGLYLKNYSASDDGGDVWEYSRQRGYY